MSFVLVGHSRALRRGAVSWPGFVVRVGVPSRWRQARRRPLVDGFFASASPSVPLSPSLSPRDCIALLASLPSIVSMPLSAICA